MRHTGLFTARYFFEPFSIVEWPGKNRKRTGHQRNALGKHCVMSQYSSVKENGAVACLCFVFRIVLQVISHVESSFDPSSGPSPKKTTQGSKVCVTPVVCFAKQLQLKSIEHSVLGLKRWGKSESGHETLQIRLLCPFLL